MELGGSLLDRMGISLFPFLLDDQTIVSSSLSACPSLLRPRCWCCLQFHSFRIDQLSRLHSFFYHSLAAAAIFRLGCQGPGGCVSFHRYLRCCILVPRTTYLWDTRVSNFHVHPIIVLTCASSIVSTETKSIVVASYPHGLYISP